MDSSKHKIIVLRIFFVLISIGALTLGFFNVRHVAFSPSDQCTWMDTEEGVKITSVLKDGASDRAGMKTGDILLQISGEYTVSSIDAQTILNNLKVGQTVTYIVFRDGNLLDLPVTLVRTGLSPFFTVMICVGFIFWLVGFWIIWMCPAETKAQILFLLFLSFLLFWSLNIIKTDTGILYWAGLVLSVLSFTTIPELFLMFCLYYPTKHMIIRKHPGLIPLLFLPTILMVLWFVLAFLFHYLSRISSLIGVGIGLWGIYFIIGLVLLIQSYRSAANNRLKNQIRFVLRGLTLGLAPIFLLQILNILQIRFPSAVYSISLLVIIPVVFAIAVVRHRLMDIEFIIRKSFVYTLLTGLIVGFYILMIQITGDLLQNISGFTGSVVFVFSTVLIAFIFAPLRGKLQSLVDRVFFREAYDYRETLRQFAGTLNRLMEPDVLMYTVLSNICGLTHIKNGYFFVRDSNTSDFISSMSYPENPEVKRIRIKNDSIFCSLLRKEKWPVLLQSYDSGYLEVDEISDAAIAVPLYSNDSLSGFIVLGEKMSETLYSVEDQKLLATIADQTAIALENGYLHTALTEQERLKRELEIARQIQLNSLPQKVPDFPGLDIFGLSIPAQEVGGDFFDYLHLSKQKLGLIIGDVSGKGTSAALYMSQIQGFFRALALQEKSPKALLNRINKLTYERIENRSFATLTLAVVDSAKQSIRIARAGHTPVLTYTQKQNCIKRWEPSGIGIALDSGRRFNEALIEEEQKLTKGDVFLFYSDGLIEAVNIDQEGFGENRLEQTLFRHILESAEDIANALIQSVRHFVKESPQSDDMTLMVVKVS